MSIAFETIQIPKQLYARLWRLAEQEQTEPVHLIERWLERAIEQTPDKAEIGDIAPIYHLHEFAQDLGVTDFAQNIDHYLLDNQKV